MSTHIQTGTKDQLPAGTPDWIVSLLDNIAVSPATTAVWGGEPVAEPVLSSIGKKLSELLNTVLKPKPGSGLPSRLRLTNWNAREGTAQFHPTTAATEVGPAPFEASVPQLDSLLKSGALDLEQPALRDVSAVQRKLRDALDAAGPEFKSEQYQRGSQPKPRRR